MADSLSITVHEDKILSKRILDLIERAPDFTRDAINEHALNVQAQAKRNLTDYPTVDTGRLRASVKIESYSADRLAVKVGSDLKYARPIEFGSRPHFPPLEPIRDWVRRHGLPDSAAYPIALKISRNGQAPRPFLFPAFEQEQPNFQKVIRDAWRQIQRELE